jgi:hypothetical protein
LEDVLHIVATSNSRRRPRQPLNLSLPLA